MPSNGKIIVVVTVEGRLLKMKVDTGAPCGIVAESTVKKIISNIML